ncbi:MAG: S-layer homology domain-containing protein [Andreesenia angusta]|nr:S-layer homology domain-containing protein [Andreesenia angusta]
MKLNKIKIISTVALSTLLLGSTSLAATYEVPVKLMKANEENPSMGANALEPKAKVVEENGRADVYLSLKGLEFMGMYGHLLNLWAYPNGISSDLSSLAPAEVVEKKMDNGLMNEYKEFPSVFKISRDKTREEVIGVRVEVDAMEEIAKTSGQENGHQNARLILDYSNAVQIDEPTPDPEPEPTPSLEKNGYANGYPDGTFKPDNSMIRAEAAKIIASALAEDYNENENYDSVFNDVEDDSLWYKNVVSYMGAKGYINGKGDGSFAPEATVTRAEFVTMIVNIMGKESDVDAQMSDIAGHWGESKIKTAIAEGWIKGYENEDGSFEFRPDSNINRAEVVTIINRVKGLEVNKSDIEANISKYKIPSDIDNTHWGFYDVLIATN